MNYKVRLVAASLVVFSVSTELSAQNPRPGSYLCITDQVSGFAFDAQSSKWVATTFVANQRFILRRVRDDDQDRYMNSKWTLSEFGQRSPMLFCRNDISNETHILSCDSYFLLMFNYDTLRFQLIYPIGYVNPAPNHEGEDTPAIQIGKCSPL